MAAGTGRLNPYGGPAGNLSWRPTGLVLITQTVSCQRQLDGPAGSELAAGRGGHHSVRCRHAFRGLIPLLSTRRTHGGGRDVTVSSGNQGVWPAPAWDRVTPAAGAQEGHFHAGNPSGDARVGLRASRPEGNRTWHLTWPGKHPAAGAEDACPASLSELLADLGTPCKGGRGLLSVRPPSDFVRRCGVAVAGTRPGGQGYTRVGSPGRAGPVGFHHVTVAQTEQVNLSPAVRESCSLVQAETPEARATCTRQHTQCARACPATLASE